ncbi:hypothetical protein [Myxococcus qinghaiensis]|uniref:hypothetical protein n=1 Tax=Myxococcus qinghaiensis TaxID=2906758 RepID=UPI0020A72F1D|nr:hypothetical protein [Myxococcus qinghaiensis]MCP3169630.1 hypothetical protein [Myxococcus qinghaiensis]
MARTGFATADGVNALRGEIFTARANLGIRNSDGSVGINAGATATIVGGEVNLGHGGNSLTLGAAFGLGAEGSAGIRDVDHDGRIEQCARGSIGAFTVGGCIEQPYKSYNPDSSGEP